jgi:hypothetical protein
MASLKELEKDVEAARAKLAADLAVLASPASRDELKSTASQEAGRLKDLLLLRAKERSRARIHDFAESVKAKAIENPAAALAIGAGVAWHFFRRPPIATALVGAGLVGLMRTRADYPRVDGNVTGKAIERLQEQASDFAGRVADQATSAAGTVTEKVSELGMHTKDQIRRAGDQAAIATRETLASATVSARDVKNSMQKASENTAKAVASATRAARSSADQWSQPVQRALRDESTRDRLLLGAAAFAITAALTLAVERRVRDGE